MKKLIDLYKKLDSKYWQYVYSSFDFIKKKTLKEAVIFYVLFVLSALGILFFLDEIFLFSSSTLEMMVVSIFATIYALLVSITMYTQRSLGIINLTLLLIGILWTFLGYGYAFGYLFIALSTLIGKGKNTSHKSAKDVKEEINKNIENTPPPTSKIKNPFNKPKDQAIEELKKIKELLDLGLITQEEFDNKSKELKKIILNS